MRNLTRRDVPPPQGVPRWLSGLMVALLAGLGLVPALGALVTGDAGAFGWRAGQWLSMTSLAVLFGPLRQWPIARLGALILAAVAAVLLALGALNEPDGAAAWMRGLGAVGASGFALMGAASLWRPRSFYGEEHRSPMAPAAANRLAVRLGVVVAVLVAVVGALLVVIFVGRPGGQ